MTADGYRVLSAHYDHPLASKSGLVLEHRKVLYDKIGPGPHPCHWLTFNNCGNDVLSWGGRELRGSLFVDHLDDDKLNNDPENLAPSCLRCNITRTQQSKGLLNAQDVRDIQELYQAGKITQKGIAEIFGVSDATINRILNRKLGWVQLKEVM